MSIELNHISPIEKNKFKANTNCKHYLIKENSFDFQEK